MVIEVVVEGTELVGGRGDTTAVIEVLMMLVIEDSVTEASELVVVVDVVLTGSDVEVVDVAVAVAVEKLSGSSNQHRQLRAFLSKLRSSRSGEPG